MSLFSSFHYMYSSWLSPLYLHLQKSYLLSTTVIHHPFCMSLVHATFSFLLQPSCLSLPLSGFRVVHSPKSWLFCLTLSLTHTLHFTPVFGSAPPHHAFLTTLVIYQIQRYQPPIWCMVTCNAVTLLILTHILTHQTYHITVISQYHLQQPPHCLSGQKMHPTCMYDVCAMSIPIIFDSVGHSVPTVCAKYMQQSALNQFFCLCRHFIACLTPVWGSSIVNVGI